MPDSKLVTALAERLRQADYKASEGTWTWEMVAEVALAFVAERLPTEDHLDELVKRAWTGACPHGKKKLGPCRSCSILRIREALLRDLRGRLGATAVIRKTGRGRGSGA